MTDSNSSIDPSKIRSEVTKLNPTLAKKLISYNTQNRPVRRQHVDAMARDMSEGNFPYTGAPIRVGIDGNGNDVLLDGQHRVLAVIKSGATIQARIEYGYPVTIQRFIDTGVARTMADQLHLEGGSNTTAVVSIARRLYSWVNFGHPSTRVPKPTHSEMRALIEDPHWQPKLQEAAHFTTVHRDGKIIPPSIMGFSHVILTDVEDAYESAVWFLARVNDGAELPATHPVMRFRQKMIRDAPEGRGSDIIKVAYLFMAWNMYRRGNTEVAKIQLPRGGVSASSDFPKPI